MSSRQIWIIVGVLLLIVVCIGSLLALTLFGVSVFSRTIVDSVPTAYILPVPTEKPGAPTKGPGTPQSPSATPRPTSSIPIDPQVQAQMIDIEGQVSQLRGLNATSTLVRNLLSPAELREFVLNDFFDDYSPEEARDDARVFSLLGLLEPDFDLLSFYTDLFSEQIAGFYDDEIKEMFVVQENGFGGLERFTYAHEFVHALQDQIYDFDEGLDYNEDSCEIESERCAAIQALVEGDATILQEEWLQTYATQQDFADLLEFFNIFQQPVFDSAPNYMQQDFLFPYTYGANFVREIRDQGGWSAVDAVYADPPVTTEQILHPERYPWDKPIVLTPPDVVDALGAGWREIEFNVLGEWFTQLVLAEYINSDRSFEAAEGWGGDVYVALANDAQNTGALLLITQWDTLDDAQEAQSAFVEYGDLRFGVGLAANDAWMWSSTEEYALFEYSGLQTLLIFAPDEDTLNIIRSAIEFPTQN
ncbi:MAG: hypothetical protein IIC78_07535 [Chloroflexi bacterium]|nr:hypothetical protein [Chloroflexota bacterium]